MLPAVVVHQLVDVGGGLVEQLAGLAQALRQRGRGWRWPCRRWRAMASICSRFSGFSTPFSIIAGRALIAGGKLVEVGHDRRQMIAGGAARAGGRGVEAFQERPDGIGAQVAELGADVGQRGEEVAGFLALDLRAGRQHDVALAAADVDGHRRQQAGDHRARDAVVGDTPAAFDLHIDLERRAWRPCCRGSTLSTWPIWKPS